MNSFFSSANESESESESEAPREVQAGEVRTRKRWEGGGNERVLDEMRLKGRRGGVKAKEDRRIMLLWKSSNRVGIEVVVNCCSDRSISNQSLLVVAERKDAKKDARFRCFTI